jgi:hypothetical protein
VPGRPDAGSCSVVSIVKGRNVAQLAAHGTASFRASTPCVARSRVSVVPD